MYWTVRHKTPGNHQSCNQQFYLKELFEKSNVIMKHSGIYNTDYKSG